ncbi:MAG: hypothetical protein ACREHD_05430 [Pirellulales bacterium]
MFLSFPAGRASPKMEAVQTVTLGGERFAILPEAELIKLPGVRPSGRYPRIISLFI